MAKYTIYRDDYKYPISADTFDEMRKLRFKGNCSFMSHGYGPVAAAYDEATHRTKYFDIYTEQEVPASERGW
jgi:hypothetical protein|nr:MAG TPA: hypothetical protein [Caudoviricetes sp.]